MKGLKIGRNFLFGFYWYTHWAMHVECTLLLFPFQSLQSRSEKESEDFNEKLNLAESENAELKAKWEALEDEFQVLHDTSIPIVGLIA